jgi:nicotinate-nucleotide adenylyltransferase
MKTQGTGYGRTKIGILGGSFDPVHNGHLLLAENAAKQLKLDIVYFVPAFIPPHKDRKLVPAFHRRRMLEIAIWRRKGFLISETELFSRQKRYTYQTIEYFSKEFSDASLFFLMGSDSAAGFKSWRNPELITRLCRIVVAQREGTPAVPGAFLQLTGAIRDVSSTEIRRRIETGLPIKNLVPVGVEEYIKKNGLYKRDKAVP